MNSKSKEINVEKRIIDAARSLFYKNGYYGTKMRDIANKAEVNLALLHYYFRKKEAIFMIVFDEAFSVLFNKIHKALTADVDFYERLRLLVSSYIDVASQNPELPMFIMHEVSRNPKLIVAIMSKHKTSNATTIDLNTFFSEINNAIRDKLIKPVDPRILFMDILSLTIFPYLSVSLLDPLFTGKKEIKQLMSIRKNHVTEMLINSIKT
jgi:AcrR family transcriptional regulator